MDWGAAARSPGTCGAPLKLEKQYKMRLALTWLLSLSAGVVGAPVAPCYRPGGCLSATVGGHFTDSAGIKLVDVADYAGHHSTRLDLETVRTTEHPAVELIRRTTEEYVNTLVPNAAVCARFPTNLGCLVPHHVSHRHEHALRLRHSSCTMFAARVDRQDARVSIDPGSAPPLHRIAHSRAGGVHRPTLMPLLHSLPSLYYYVLTHRSRAAQASGA